MAAQKQAKGLDNKHTFEGTYTCSLCFPSYPDQDQVAVAAACGRSKSANHGSCVPCAFSALKELTMKVLNCMSSFISLPSIIQRILQVCV